MQRLTKLSNLVATLVPSCTANIAVGVERLGRSLLVDALLDLRSRAFAVVVNAEMDVEQVRNAGRARHQPTTRRSHERSRSRLDLSEVAHGRRSREDPATRGANGAHRSELQGLQISELVDDEAVEAARTSEI